MKRIGITRRDFLRNSTTAAIAGSLYGSLPGRLFAQKKTETRVVLVRHPDVLDSQNRPVEGVLEKMMDEAILALTGKQNVREAWKSLFRPSDIVGVKTNVWQYLRTPPELEKILRARLEETGIKKEKIAMDDRGVRDNPVFKNSTALINTRPLRTHHWAGVGSLLKNYIMFSPKPSSYHDDSCADLAKLWELEPVKGKTRLNILVMLTPLFHGTGPHHFSSQYIWPYHGLLLGTDPVAVDATGVRILQAKRKAYFKEDRPLNPPPKHVFLADTRHRLGTADPEKIDLIRLGWEKDILI